MKYQLTIAFTPEQLRRLKASHQQLVLARGMNGSNPNLAWLVNMPFEQNTITWEEAYGFYTSTTGVETGNILIMNSLVYPPVQRNKIYVFNNSGAIEETRNEAPGNGGYALQNDFTGIPVLSTGLTQGAIVNGQERMPGPVTAAALPTGHMHLMQPDAAVYVWLSDSAEIAQVTTPPANACRVALDPANPAIHLVLDENTAGLRIG